MKSVMSTWRKYVDSTKLIKLGHWFAGSNKGAYLKLNPQLDTHFVQYTAAASKTRKLTFRQRIGLVESSALRELGARLRERRNELEREFNARDPGATGKNNYFSSMFPRSLLFIDSASLCAFLVRLKPNPAKHPNTAHHS